MVWGAIAKAVGSTAIKLGAKEAVKGGVKLGAKATGKALIKKGAGKALKHVGKQHLAKAERQAVRREGLRGTDRKTLQRGYGSPMDIENV